MDLHFTPLTAHIILQLPLCRDKSVPYRYIDIFMLAILARLTIHHQLTTGHRHIDANVIELPLVVSSMWSCHNYSTTHDSVIEHI
jgi:hypothetical protein